MRCLLKEALTLLAIQAAICQKGKGKGTGTGGGSVNSLGSCSAGKGKGKGSGGTNTGSLLSAGVHHVCGWETHKDSAVRGSAEWPAGLLSEQDCKLPQSSGAPSLLSSVLCFVCQWKSPLFHPADPLEELCGSSAGCTSVQMGPSGLCVLGDRSRPCSGLEDEDGSFEVGHTAHVALVCEGAPTGPPLSPGLFGTSSSFSAASTSTWTEALSSSTSTTETSSSSMPTSATPQAASAVGVSAAATTNSPLARPTVEQLVSQMRESVASPSCPEEDVEAALAGGDKHVCGWTLRLGEAAHQQRSEVGPLSLADCQALCVATPSGGCTSVQMEGGTCHHGAFKKPTQHLAPVSGWDTYIPDICCGAPTTAGEATTTEATEEATTTSVPAIVTLQDLVSQITFRVYTRC